MNEQHEACNVCGNNDYNLHDGFYYCTECGTQDTKLQQTIVDFTQEDGTIFKGARRKIRKAFPQPSVEMPHTWYHWHTCNFLLYNVADELIDLGAQPSFKKKLLWVWTKYMKVHLKKEHIGLPADDPKEDQHTISDTDSDDSDKHIRICKRHEISRHATLTRQSSMTLIIALLYVALNIDNSDIQLTHLLRFVRDRRISYPYNIQKLVPKELKPKKFVYNSTIQTRVDNKMVRKKAMALFRKLKLGSPVVPNLRLIVEDLLKELCLPIQFKNIVFSLMQFYPSNYLDIVVNEEYIARLPHYEMHCMAYILWALKLCFGLDCQYELSVSRVVDKINKIENRPKRYVNEISTPTDRLFSFREWCSYIHFRKKMLEKHCYFLSERSSFDVCDYVAMAKAEDKQFQSRSKKLNDEIADDVIKRIPGGEPPHGIIPQSQFKPTKTPFSTYTRVLVDYIQDPEVKLSLAEDFTQYSIKYLTEDMELIDPDDVKNKNIITGISKENKTETQDLIEVEKVMHHKQKKIFVRDCDNLNWTTTREPIIVEEPDVTDTSISVENGTIVLNNITGNTNVKLKDKIMFEDDVFEEFAKEEKLNLEIKEESEDINIFDDKFEDLNVTKSEIANKDDNHMQEFPEFQEMHDFTHSQIDNSTYDNSSLSSIDSLNFDPENFDRAKIIKELVIKKCKEFKISIPYKYKDKKNIHSKPPLRKPADYNKRIQFRNINYESMMAEYLSYLQQDTLLQISTKVKEAIQNRNQSTVENEIQEEIPMDTSAPIDNEDNNNVTIDESIQKNDDLNNSDSGKDKSVFSEDSDGETYGKEFLPVKNPKFDDETHDTTQLYVKVSKPEAPDIELDPKLVEIVDHKLERDTKDPSLLEWNSPKIKDHTDSEDEMIISTLKENYEIYKKVTQPNEADLEPFVNKDIPEFNYWFNFFKTQLIRTQTKEFHKQLIENFPKSFVFVINTSAEIIDCSKLDLYKVFSNFEISTLQKFKINIPVRKISRKVKIL